jgi:hypothetical protein
MADIPNKPPSPEVIAVIAWLAQNAWVTGVAIIFALGRAVFGDVKKDVSDLKSDLSDFKADYREQSKGRDAKLDAIAESLNELARVVYELRGETKHKERPTK